MVPVVLGDRPRLVFDRARADDWRMWPHSADNYILVPVAGIHVLRREEHLVEWITEVAAHPGGFGFQVRRKWWARLPDEEPAIAASYQRDTAPREVLDGPPVEESGVWGVVAGTGPSGPDGRGHPPVPRFTVMIALPDGRTDSMSEFHSFDEYLARFEAEELLLTTNNPAVCQSEGLQTTTSDDPAWHGWQFHESELTVCAHRSLRADPSVCQSDSTRKRTWSTPSWTAHRSALQQRRARCSGRERRWATPRGAPSDEHPCHLPA